MLLPESGDIIVHILYDVLTGHSVYTRNMCPGKAIEQSGVAPRCTRKQNIEQQQLFIRTLVQLSFWS